MPWLGPNRPITIAANPSWYDAMTDKTWTAVAGGAAYGSTYQNGTRLDGIATDTDPCAPWVGAATRPDASELTILVPSGHNDRNGRNEVFSVDFLSEQPGWVTLNSGSSDRSAGDATSNGAANYADGLPRGCHTYERVVGYRGGYWLTSMDNFASSSGLNSTAHFRFRRDTNAWTAYGQAFNSTQWADVSSWHGGASATDPYTGYIWVLAQSTDATGKYAGYIIDSADGTVIRRIKVNLSGWGYHSSVILHDRSPRLWVIAEGAASLSHSALRAIDISTLPADGAQVSFSTLNTSGTILWPRSGSDHGGTVYHSASNALLMWDGTGTRSSINKTPIPNDMLGGTWTGANVTADPSNTVTPSAAQVSGTFGRFNLISFPSGRQALVVFNGYAEPVYVYKLPLMGI